MIGIGKLSGDNIYQIFGSYEALRKAFELGEWEAIRWEIGAGFKN